MSTNKFIDIEGEVVKRIFNTKQTSKSGYEYQICWLVVKWITGPNNEYVDYVPIKTLSPVKLHDIREGYRIKTSVQYSCKIKTDEVKTSDRTWNNVTTTSPTLFPEFSLSKNAKIEILDSSNNYEQHTTSNNSFEEQMNASNQSEEDDLPF